MLSLHGTIPEVLRFVLGISAWEAVRYIGEEIADTGEGFVLQGYRRALYDHAGISHNGHFKFQQRMPQHASAPDEHSVPLKHPMLFPFRLKRLSQFFHVSVDFEICSILSKLVIKLTGKIMKVFAIQYRYYMG